MKTERILLPVDIGNCPLDVFPLVDRLASRPGTALTLLHVVTLNILAPESRIYDEVSAEAHANLERVGQKYLPYVAEVVTRVRFGKVGDEILDEIRAENADLIIAPTHGASFAQRLIAVWKTPFHPTMSRGIDRIIREAGCAVFIASSRVRFDCARERQWPNPEPSGFISAVQEANGWDCESMVASQRRFDLKHC
jgi:nucleotide-binding universal stress UspA family protein